MNAPSIVVIIAAFNAQETIARAVRSALLESEVSQVIVVDDASTDNTAEIARTEGGTDDRLKLLVQKRNGGPSAARNWAISESQAPLIAILDADDFLMPGRFKRMLSERDWDLCADNLIFFSEPAELSEIDEGLPGNGDDNFDLDFEHFVAGNISQRKRVRGELGFLKPIIRRSFLEENDLNYDEDCRLGEDFILYAQSLAKGAKFKVIDSCGYAAQVRNNSLSGSHGVSELKTLHGRCTNLLNTLSLSKAQRAILKRHLFSIKRKVIHRQVLEVRSEKGMISGILAAARNPTAIIRYFAGSTTPSEPNKTYATEAVNLRRSSKT